MLFQALIELAPTPTRPLAHLADVAYRASHAAPVAVVLRDLTAPAASRLFDPVVAAVGHHVSGVAFLRADDTTAVLRAAASARMVVGVTPAFRAWLESYGVRVLSPDEGLDALEGTFRLTGEPLCAP